MGESGGHGRSARARAAGPVEAEISGPPVGPGRLGPAAAAAAADVETEEAVGAAPRPPRVPTNGVASPARRRAGGSSANGASHGNTPTVEDPAPARPSTDKATMLSDSQSEREIAEFGRILDDMLARVSCRELVKKTADYMAAFPQHALRLQLKMKQVCGVDGASRREESARSWMDGSSRRAEVW